MDDPGSLLPSQIKAALEPYSSTWSVFNPAFYPPAKQGARAYVKVAFKCSCGKQYEQVATSNKPEI